MGHLLDQHCQLGLSSAFAEADNATSVLTWKQLSAMLVKPETEGYRSCTEQSHLHSCACFVTGR